LAGTVFKPQIEGGDTVFVNIEISKKKGTRILEGKVRVFDRKIKDSVSKRTSEMRGWTERGCIGTGVTRENLGVRPRGDVRVGDKKLRGERD